MEIFKKRYSNWAILGFAAGVVFAIGSFVRYYALYPDMDKALTDILIGGIVCGLAFLYQRQMELSHSVGAVEEYLADKQDKGEEI